jgi:hypothetical protein
MEWFDCSIPFCPSGSLNLAEFDAVEDRLHIQVKDKIFGEDWLKCFATEILDAKYECTDVADVVDELTHLNKHQKSRFALSAIRKQKDVQWKSWCLSTQESTY